MNPLELQLRELERQIADIRRGMDIEFTESLRRNTLQGIIEAGVVDAPGTDLNKTSSTNVGSVPTTVTVQHAAQYDDRVRVTIDGSDYFIGLYSA